MTVFLFSCGSNVKGKIGALEGRRVGSESPSRVRDRGKVNWEDFSKCGHTCCGRHGKLSLFGNGTTGKSIVVTTSCTGVTWKWQRQQIAPKVHSRWCYRNKKNFYFLGFIRVVVRVCTLALSFAPNLPYFWWRFFLPELPHFDTHFVICDITKNINCEIMPTLRVLIIVPRSFRFFLQWQSEAKAALATYGRRLLHWKIPCKTINTPSLLLSNVE